MNAYIYVPSSPREAAQHLRAGWRRESAGLAKPDFVRAWSAVAYLFPGLHPDGFDDSDSGWPRVLKRFAAEAWRRAEAGELEEEELYPSDAQWAGIYDRMPRHTPEETARRMELVRTSSL
jgi:hypothetical protein